MRRKSQQLKAVGKACVGPCLFNIGDPLVFALPIMYNPIIAIPFIINPMVGFLPPHIMLSTAMPIFLQECFGSFYLSNLLIPVIGFVISYLIYLPFVKAYDKQPCAQEAAERQNYQKPLDLLRK